MIIMIIKLLCTWLRLIEGAFHDRCERTSPELSTDVAASTVEHECIVGINIIKEGQHIPSDCFKMIKIL